MTESHDSDLFLFKLHGQLWVSSLVSFQLMSYVKMHQQKCTLVVGFMFCLFFKSKFKGVLHFKIIFTARKQRFNHQKKQRCTDSVIIIRSPQEVNLHLHPSQDITAYEQHPQSWYGFNVLFIDTSFLQPTLSCVGKPPFTHTGPPATTRQATFALS